MPRPAAATHLREIKILPGGRFFDVRCLRILTNRPNKVWGDPMPKHSNRISERLEMAALYLRAHRAVEEAHKLAADQEFINHWCRMKRHVGVREEGMLDDT
jgi:hypothetical protein